MRATLLTGYRRFGDELHFAALKTLHVVQQILVIHKLNPAVTAQDVGLQQNISQLNFKEIITFCVLHST